MTNSKQHVSLGVAAGVAALLAVALGLTACGGDDGGGTAVADQARFCDLAAQLDSTAVGVGAASAPGTFDGPPAAMGNLLDQMGPTIDELAKVAPDEVSGDVKVVVDGLRTAREDNQTATQARTFSQAATRIATFRGENCLVGGDSGGDQ